MNGESTGPPGHDIKSFNCTIIELSVSLSFAPEWPPTQPLRVMKCSDPFEGNEMHLFHLQKHRINSPPPHQVWSSLATRPAIQKTSKKEDTAYLTESQNKVRLIVSHTTIQLRMKPCYPCIHAVHHFFRRLCLVFLIASCRCSLRRYSATRSEQ